MSSLAPCRSNRTPSPRRWPNSSGPPEAADRARQVLLSAVGGRVRCLLGGRLLGGRLAGGHLSGRRLSGRRLVGRRARPTHARRLRPVMFSPATQAVSSALAAASL